MKFISAPTVGSNHWDDDGYGYGDRYGYSNDYYGHRYYGHDSRHHGGSGSGYGRYGQPEGDAGVIVSAHDRRLGG